MSIKKIGSFEWMQSTNGHLTTKEKLKLLNEILLPSMLGVMKSQLHIGSSKSNINLKDIKVPDTKIIVEAINELNEKAPGTLINHSWRTYFWGAAIGLQDQRKYDPEVLLVASLYHDIGLTDNNKESKGCRCFTYESSIQFEKKAKHLNYDENKIKTVKDAICMHMNGHIAEDNESEVILLQQGASCDVVGDKLFTLSKDYRTEVLEKYPRLRFNSEFKKLLAEERKTVKSSRTKFLSQLGLPVMISMNPFGE